MNRSLPFPFYQSYGDRDLVDWHASAVLDATSTLVASGQTSQPALVLFASDSTFMATARLGARGRVVLASGSALTVRSHSFQHGTTMLAADASVVATATSFGDDVVPAPDALRAGARTGSPIFSR